jgi:hypothetical protein
MIRKSSLVSQAVQRDHTFKSCLGAALVAAAALAAPAHATILDFEGLAGPVGGTETISYGNLNVGFYANVEGDGAGYLVGNYYNDNAFACDPAYQACPTGNGSTWYGGLNDSYIDISSNDGSPFRIASFDASFIGGNAALGSYPSTPAVLRVQGFRADRSYLVQDFVLGGATPAGFPFQHFTTSGAFGSETFVDAYIFAFACNGAGECTAFDSDRAQFGIDNIEVPEPGTFAMMGLGLMGLAGARRRRQS